MYILVVVIVAAIISALIAFAVSSSVPFTIISIVVLPIVAVVPAVTWLWEGLYCYQQAEGYEGECTHKLEHVGGVVVLAESELE